MLTRSIYICDDWIRITLSYQRYEFNCWLRVKEAPFKSCDACFIGDVYNRNVYVSWGLLDMVKRTNLYQHTFNKIALPKLNTLKRKIDQWQF